MMDVPMAMQPATGFDPYRAWLNVREANRPLNAYQLLGLPMFEADEKTIRTAIDAKRKLLVTHRNEAADVDLWRQIAKELDNAARTLLEAERKKAYDAGLPQRENVSSTPQPAFEIPTESAAGNMVCPGCGTPNPASRRFCVNCGLPLWEPCPNCNTLSSAGEKFCGSCGTNLALASHQRAEQAEAGLIEAERLQNELRFEEAIEVLHRVAKAGHPRLAHFARQADERIREIAGELERQRTAADDALAKAESRMSESDFAGVVAELESVPAALHTEAMAALLAGAKGRVSELSQLNQELRAAVRARNVEGLMPTVERLLELDADHAEALKVAQLLREHHCRLAEKKAAAHQYDEAVALLEEIPEILRTPATQELHAKYSERSHIFWDLRCAPVVDATLMARAELMAGDAAGDARVVKLAEEMRRRLQRGPKSRYGGTIPWAPAPETTPLSYPVDWLTSPQRLTVKEDLDPAVLNGAPGCFFVACGLALQGLGQASLRYNLLPPDYRTMLGRMTQMMLQRPARTAWGLDLSSGGLKAVRLAWDERQQTAVIEEAALIEHRKVLGQAANEGEEDRILEETFRAFATQCPTKADRVCVGLPGRVLLFRQFKIPPIEAAKLASLVEYESRHHIPVPLEELVWDYQVMGAPPPTSGKRFGLKKADALAERMLANRDLEIMVLGAKRAHIQRMLARMKTAGIYVDVVQGDALALHNCYQFEYGPAASPAEAAAETPPPDAAKKKDAVVLLDIGNDATNVVVSSPELTWFRNIGIGGLSFTRALVQELNQTFVQAEEIKRGTLPMGQGIQFQRALQAVCDDLLKETRLSLTSFNKSWPEHRIARAYALGGGMLMHGLFRYLRAGR